MALYKIADLYPNYKDDIFAGSVRKEVEKDTVEAKEKLRREELEVDVDGNPNVKRR